MPKAELTPAKKTALDWIDANRDRLSRDHQTIWSFHEPSWREYRSAAWYVERLRSEGFEVEAGSGGMPTAFCATWSNGDGPTIGGYAEYDAVPGQSQEAVPYRKPREGVNRFAAGHTDPHSALGIGSFTGFLAAKRAMEQHGLKGRLKFFGEPAEKMCGSKPVHAAKGYYDDLDAAFSFHPHSFPALANSCFWDTHCAAYWSRIYTFECPSPETWNASAANVGVAHVHNIARAPGAIDAVCLMYTSSKYMKEAMLPHTGSWSLNEYIPIAGQAAADNLAPNISQIQYSLRAPSLEMCEQVFAVLDRNAEHCAAMSHCTVSKAWITRTRLGLANHAMAEITYDNFELIGPPQWGEEARAFARELQKNLGVEPMEDPFAPEIQVLTTPQEGEAWFRSQLPSWQHNISADDYVDYTWHAPTVRLYVARPALRAAEGGFRYPEWARYAMCGTPACIDPMWETAGRVIAATIVDLLTEPEHLRKARAEFEERTGGGIGGSQWVAPLLPKDFAPPVHYRWPEYIDTVRGSGEWTIPTSEPVLGKADQTG
ncbi:amidohydrolase [Rhodoligotrophos defluvii]|uniref:amidohydrolase n=1 Tax=Rhodoligotrophos defluvii TaxID=2561934 RepID=UPI0010C967B4|nr:amidohydrolase [Rhodoligotrophos defluvii]